MDSVQLSLALFAVVLAIATQSGSALQCHVCNSGSQYEGDKCWHLKTGSNDFKMDCSQLNEEHKTNHTYTMCRKMYQSVEGDKRIIRDCAIAGEDRCVERTGTYKIRMTYCECEGDGCNSAGVAYVSLITMVASVVMAMVGMRS